VKALFKNRKAEEEYGCKKDKKQKPGLSSPGFCFLSFLHLYSSSAFLFLNKAFTKL